MSEVVMTEKEKLEARTSVLAEGHRQVQESKTLRTDVAKTKLNAEELHDWTKKLTEKFNTNLANRK